MATLLRLWLELGAISEEVIARQLSVFDVDFLDLGTRRMRESACGRFEPRGMTEAWFAAVPTLRSSPTSRSPAH